MKMLNAVISAFYTPLLRWVDNLPPTYLYIGMGIVILTGGVIFFFLIRFISSQSEAPTPTKNTPSPSPKRPLKRPAEQPVKLPDQGTPKRPAEHIPERPVEKKPESPMKSHSELPSKQLSENALKSSSDSASAIYSKIASIGGTNKSVLLAGAGLEYLPVTIPVQVAVQLAGTGKKVLLIDLDTRRNAAAKAFDLNEDSIKNCTLPKALPTSVENLFLWPAEFFVRFAQMNLRMTIQSAATQFEIILINSPYLDGHPDRKLIASCAKYGLIFCQTTQQFERLQKLLTEGQCKLLEPKPVIC